MLGDLCLGHLAPGLVRCDQVDPASGPPKEIPGWRGGCRHKPAISCVHPVVDKPRLSNKEEVEVGMEKPMARFPRLGGEAVDVDVSHPEAQILLGLIGSNGLRPPW